MDEARSVASRFGVQGIPLLILHRDRREIGRLTGAVPVAQLQSWLDQQLTAEPRP